MKKNLIVSSADNKYFDLLLGLINSVKANSKYESYDIAVLSIGLSKENQQILSNLNIPFTDPIWNVQVPQYKILGRNHLKTQVARFFLDDYFPGYQNYIWMDSDMWINDFEVFELYVKGSEKSGFAITPQVDRAYHRLMNIKWFGMFPIKINSINYKNISRSISRSTGRKFAAYATLNAGCFAYNYKFEGMKIIRSNLKQASQKGRIFGSDQVALCLSVFRDKISAELLPAYCNWMCDSHMPHYSIKLKKFVEPYLPHNPIACIHLAGMNEDRFHNKQHLVKLIEGGNMEMNLKFNSHLD